MDNELIVGILKDFKLFNNITDASNDNLFSLYIKKTIQTILNLTNRYEFPNELRYLVLDMANEFYTDTSLLQTVNSEATSESIKSISEAGRQVTFGSASESTINSLLNKYVDTRATMHLKEINKYKLLYKVKKNG